MAGAPATNDAMSAALARNWWLVALRGVLAILFGIVAILLPGPTLAALVLLFAAYMVVDGVLAIVAAVRAARRHERWGWLIFEGIVDLAAAAIAFLFPVATIFAFVLLMGALGDHQRRDAVGRRLPPQPRAWPVADGVRRHHLGDLGLPADPVAGYRRLGADLVDKRLRPDLRRGAAGARLPPAPARARGAAGRRAAARRLAGC